MGIDCHGFSKGDKVKLAARPENIQIIKKKNKKSVFTGKVVDIEFLGAFLRVYLETSIMPDKLMVADNPIVNKNDEHFRVGEAVNFVILPNFLNIFKNE